MFKRSNWILSYLYYKMIDLADKKIKEVSVYKNLQSYFIIMFSMFH